jgi:predicted transcriptional regulator
MAISTIQLSTKVKGTLTGMKLHARESYNDVLERILEDLSELDESTLREIETARRQIKAGRYLTHDQVRDKLRL